MEKALVLRAWEPKFRSGTHKKSSRQGCPSGIPALRKRRQVIPRAS